MIVAVRARFQKKGPGRGSDQRRETTRQQAGPGSGHRPPVVQGYGGVPGRAGGGEGDIPVEVIMPEPGWVGDERLRRFPRDRRVGCPPVEIRHQVGLGHRWECRKVMGALGECGVSFPVVGGSVPCVFDQPAKAGLLPEDRISGRPRPARRMSHSSDGNPGISRSAFFGVGRVIGRPPRGNRATIITYYDRGIFVAFPDGTWRKTGAHHECLSEVSSQDVRSFCKH